MESSAPEIYVNPANPAQKLLRNFFLIKSHYNLHISRNFTTFATLFEKGTKK